MKAPVRILIADDHAIVRLGLQSLLEMEDDLEVVGQALDGQEAVDKALSLKPDILVLDLVMPEMDGVTVVQELHRRQSATKIIILTTFGTSDGIAHALENGAFGALLKSSTETELVKAIRAVANGKRYLSADIQSQLANDPPIPKLTARQLQAIEYMTRGLSNVDIARLGGCSETAVKKLLASTFAKLGVANRAEAVAIALRKQLVKI